MNILKYLDDGADLQAQAVLAFVKVEVQDWGEAFRFDVDRWNNGREKGYVISYIPTLEVNPLRQLNIAFSESRNSDCIVVCAFECQTINPPTFMNRTEEDWRNEESFDYKNFAGAAKYIVESIYNFNEQIKG